MNELEQQLRELAADVEYPPTPELATSLAARLDEELARRRAAQRRRLLLVAVGALGAVAAAVLSVSQTRTVVFELLGLRRAAIERVRAVAEPRAADDLGLGRRVSLAQARRLVAYPLVLPAFEAGPPKMVYVDARPPGGRVVMLLSDDGGEPILFTQFRGETDDRVIREDAPVPIRVQPLAVSGVPGYWLEGEPRRFRYVDATGKRRAETSRLAGGTLVWERGELLLALEGEVTKERAVEIARTVG